LNSELWAPAISCSLDWCQLFSA